MKPLFYKLFIVGIAAFLIGGCNSATTSSEENTSAATATQEVNPPAEEFNLVGSDQKAIKIADEVMETMGGRVSWDTTRYLSWNFFGRRTLIWDKLENRVRIDMVDGSMSAILDMNNMTGKVALNGVEQTEADSVSKYLDRAKSTWINDSYWLVMPYKLKDSGVTLKYVREDTTQTGASADVLQLTFEKVGVTPENKYEVCVDKQSKLVTQWAYYPSANDTTARFVTPWAKYEKKGAIMLSGDRGQFQLTDINVYAALPEEVFTSLNSVGLSNYSTL